MMERCKGEEGCGAVWRASRHGADTLASVGRVKHSLLPPGSPSLLPSPKGVQEPRHGSSGARAEAGPPVVLHDAWRFSSVQDGSAGGGAVQGGALAPSPLEGSGGRTPLEPRWGSSLAGTPRSSQQGRQAALCCHPQSNEL